MKRIKSLLAFLGNKFFALNAFGKVIVLIIAITAVYFIYKNFAKKSIAPRYQTATVAKENIISSISESGSVSSMSQTDIGSPTNGVIQEVYVKNGDEVSAGQNLFKVKSTATPQEQSSAYASFLSAQNSLNSAKAKINSLQAALFQANQTFINDKGIPNPTDQDKQDPKYIEENANWLQAQADYNNQAGVIAAAQASYNNASLAYAATQDSIVTAPIAGTVANFSVVVGSNVTASGTTYNNSNTASNSNSSSAPVLVLGNFSNLSITVPVSEVDISKIKAGQKATISLDAYPNLTYVGKVDSVDTIGTNSSGVVTFNAYISFVSPPPTIKPGMSATAVIQIARADDVLGVPTQAVQTASDGTSYVRVLKNGKISQVTVTTGLSSDIDTEITSGLNAGDTVVTGETTPASASINSTGTSPFSSLGGGFGGGNARFIGGAGGGGGARRTFTTGGGGR